MQTFKPRRKFFKGKGRLRTEVLVGYVFFLIILAAGPVISLMVGSSKGASVGVKVLKGAHAAATKKDIFTYLEEHPTEFVLFCLIGAGVLAALYVLYQSQKNQLLSLSFDDDAGMVTVELVKPYKEESTLIKIPISELQYNVSAKDLGNMRAAAKHIPIISIKVNEAIYTIEIGKGPWETTDLATVKELEVKLRSPIVKTY